MKLMIASDIHGSAYYCRQMIEAYKREKAEKLLILGDILYHGPRNDLPRDYEPKTVIQMLNEMKEEKIGEYFYMNPGSVSIPKEDSEHSYMIIEDGVYTWKNMEGDSYRTVSIENIK